MDRRETLEAELIGAESAVANACFFHEKPPRTTPGSDPEPHLVPPRRLYTRKAACFRPVLLAGGGTIVTAQSLVKANDGEFSGTRAPGSMPIQAVSF
jgi:hypothetical protein